MKCCLGILCCALIAGVGGYVVKLNNPTVVQPRFATAGWLHRQKLILELFENVCEVSTNPMIVRMANQFSLDDVLSKYSLTDLATNFRNLYEVKGLLAMDDIFSEYNADHLEELRLIYNLLYYANDFDIFYTTAAWARQNVNCGIFIDAMYAAVIHRRDTEKIAVPAPYEILPNYFIRRDAIAKTILLFKNKDMPLPEIIGVHVDGNVYTVDANYTGAIDSSDESKISYFTEDVGLNTFYYFMNLRNAHWFNRVDDGTNIRGEYWYYIIRQLNARYNLERIANGLKEVEGLSWSTPIDTSYDPMLMYSNGRFFPERVNSLTVNPDDATYLVDFENHISNMVQDMTEFNKTVLMNTIFDLMNTEDKNYDWTARRALGSDVVDVNSRLPSVLEHYATTLRDPIYWRLNKQFLNMFNIALKVLDPYAHNQLYFPGVEVMDIAVKKMQTFIDYNVFDVTDSVTTNVVDSLIHVNIGQPRLNHKPFSIKINVASLVSQKALVKIFIGPKFLPTDIALKKDSLKQLDSFEYILKVGTNIIIRKSDEINNVAGDFVPFRTLFKKVEEAELGLEPLYFADIDSIVGFPSRLILPKGTAEGFPLQLYVIVAPFVKVRDVYEMEFNKEILSLGYPFDRRIDNPKLFDLANTMYKDILITHKGDSKVNGGSSGGTSKKWQPTETGSYGPKEKSTFDYQSKKQSDYKSYDYTAKKGQYENQKFDYESKRLNRTGTVKPDPVVTPAESITVVNVIPIELVQTTENVYINPQISTNIEDREGVDYKGDVLADKHVMLDDDETKYLEGLNGKYNKKPVYTIPNIFKEHPASDGDPFVEQTDHKAMQIKWAKHYLGELDSNSSEEPIYY